MKAMLAASILLSMTFTGCEKQNPRTIATIASEASPKGQFPWQPMDGHVITSWIDPRAGTMSTLYGNDLATAHASTDDQPVYPPGAIVSLVTWKQKEDPRWLGAEIPDTVESIEFVLVRGTAGRVAYTYRSFDGVAATQIASVDGPTPDGRSAFLLSQRMSPLP